MINKKPILWVGFRLMTNPIPKDGVRLFSHSYLEKQENTFLDSKKISFWGYCPILLQEKMSVDFVNAQKSQSSGLTFFLNPFSSGQRKKPQPKLRPNFLLEQVTRIGLAWSAWKAEVLPLNYTCKK